MSQKQRRFPETVYHHMRPMDAAGKPLPNGGVTIAIEIPQDGSVINFGFARCHEKDSFCKRTGRVKAMGHLKSKTTALAPFRFSLECDLNKIHLDDIISTARMITTHQIEEQRLNYLSGNRRSSTETI